MKGAHAHYKKEEEKKMGFFDSVLGQDEFPKPANQKKSKPATNQPAKPATSKRKPVTEEDLRKLLTPEKNDELDVAGAMSDLKSDSGAKMVKSYLDSLDPKTAAAIVLDLGNGTSQAIIQYCMAKFPKEMFELIGSKMLAFMVENDEAREYLARAVIKDQKCRNELFNQLNGKNGDA